MIAQATSVVAVILFIALFREQLSLSERLLIIVASSIVLTVCDTFQSTSYKASTNSMVAAEHRQKLVAYEQLTDAGAVILAPILGGLLAGVVAISNIALLELAGESVVLLAIALLDFHLISVEVEAISDSLILSIKNGLEYFKNDRYLMELLLFAVIANFALSGLEVSLPIAMMKELGIPANLYGLADSFCAGGMLLVSLLLGSFKMPKNYLLTTGRIGIILAGDFIILALACLCPNKLLATGIFSICMLVVGACLAAVNLPYAMYVRTKVPVNLQGRVGATTSSVVAVLSPLGYALFGLVLGQVKPVWCLMMCAIIIFADGLRLLLSTSRVNSST
ncbi:major facilitator superfamily transporter [Lactobacillus delbrueckii]|nr:major facilitator superfamily transporter [Lactobacillus delbrueckii]